MGVFVFETSRRPVVSLDQEWTLFGRSGWRSEDDAEEHRLYKIVFARCIEREREKDGGGGAM